MAKIRYTVTTTTKRCPLCGELLEEETRGALTPILAILALPLFFIAIPCLIIAWQLHFASYPKLGEKIVTCPNCSTSVCIYKQTKEDLIGEELVAYRFRVWIVLCYALGVVFGCSGAALLDGMFPIVSWCGLICVLSLIGIIAIIVAYRVNEAKCN